MKSLFHAGNVILFGFGIMILFMTYLVIRCTQNPSVMVSDQYYEQELVYQDKIDAQENTIPLDALFSLEHQGTDLQIKIPAEINNKLTKATLVVYNQADDRHDKTIAIPKNADGVYMLSAANWANGSYKLKLSIEAGAKKYYKEFSYQL
jgi:nitrogen fixation protein FixH